MTQAEAGKLPEKLQLQEDKLRETLANLKIASVEAIRAGDRLQEVLQEAKNVLDQNNY